MRKVIKNNLFGFLLGMLLCGGIVCAASYYANDVAYEPEDTSWEVNDVDEALNDLYKIINENSIISDELVDHTETVVTLEEDKSIIIVYARYAQSHWTTSNTITYPTISIEGEYDKEISFKDYDSWWIDENDYYRKNGMIVKAFTNVKAGTKINVTGSTSSHILY